MKLTKVRRIEGDVNALKRIRSADGHAGRLQAMVNSGKQGLEIRRRTLDTDETLVTA